MKIKRFFASDIRDAMRQVREEQGADAVILSNRAVEGGVEIVAAVDYDENLLQTLAPAAEEPVANSAPGSAAPTPVTSPAKILWSQEPALVQMRGELRAVRGLLEHQLSGLAFGDMARRHPQRTRLIRLLLQSGFNPSLCEQVAERIPEQKDFAHTRRLALGVLAHQLPTSDFDLLDSGGVVALLGPTGVGKTTTVAKLAARFALRHGARHVALVTTDNYRIGAHEQLQTYARVLDVPLRIARSREELNATLRSLSGRRLVLIDTAGMSQRDLRLSEQLQMIHSDDRPLRRLLVMSVTTQLQALQETVTAFLRSPVDGCVLTKLDEAASLGAALSVVVERRLPVAWVSDGQRVPEDLKPARAHGLISRCIALANQAARNGSPYQPEMSGPDHLSNMVEAVTMAMSLGGQGRNAGH